ncbi:MAG: hypothetical protein WA957_10400 [Alteraurantiacibacter sp.]
MKLAVLVIAASIGIAVPGMAQAQDGTPDARLELAQEIIETGYPLEARMGMFDQVIGQMLTQMRASFPNLKESAEAGAIYDRHAERVQATSMDVLSRHIDPIMNSLAVAYSDQFTLEELQALHSFIMSPQGNGFLARMADANAHPAFAEANQAYMQEYLGHMPELMQKLADDVEEINAQ